MSVARRLAGSMGIGLAAGEPVTRAVDTLQVAVVVVAAAVSCYVTSLKIPASHSRAKARQLDSEPGARWPRRRGRQPLMCL
jgi:hypothetical protein